MTPQGMQADQDPVADQASRLFASLAKVQESVAHPIPPMPGVTVALNFTRWPFISDLHPSSVLDLQDACGVYVLEFDDGTQYVGQALNFPSRLGTHRRTYRDIEHVQFTPVPREALDETEFAVIQDRQTRGIPLRNKTMVSSFSGPAPLDLVIDEQVQAEWLQADHESDDIVIGRRGELAARRARSLERFQALQDHEHWEDVLESLAHYVGWVIPHAHQTERRTWTVTALPSTNRFKDARRLSTLSINNVEVLILV